MKYREAKQRLLAILQEPEPKGRAKVDDECEVEKIEYDPNTDTFKIIERWVDK